MPRHDKDAEIDIKSEVDAERGGLIKEIGAEFVR